MYLLSKHQNMDALEEALKLAETNGEIHKALADHLVPMDTHDWVSIISLIGQITHMEPDSYSLGEGGDDPVAFWTARTGTDEQGRPEWTHVVTLTRHAVIIGDGLERDDVERLTGYCVLRGIPLINFAYMDHVVSDRHFRVVMDELERQSADLHAQAEAEPDNKELHNRLLDQLHELAMPPKKDSLLHKAWHARYDRPRRNRNRVVRPTQTRH
jgi:hypothetical protein